MCLCYRQVVVVAASVEAAASARTAAEGAGEGLGYVGRVTSRVLILKLFLS